jgi:hypothetical protein
MKGVIMTLTAETMHVHVRFNGRSEDLDLETLGLPIDAGDVELRAALARRYDCAVGDLDSYVIAREWQAIVVRPVAFYG